MIRVATPCRLHFGLFAVPTSTCETHRRFGGVGLMIDGPRVAVAVERSAEWLAVGPSSERALAFAKLVSSEPLSITVEECPPEHVGLGVGTQLGLAVADAVNRLLSGDRASSRDLAKQVGRGERSGIGVQGYGGGGLIVDAGKASADSPSAIVGTYAVPEAWRVVLLRPKTPVRWHGTSERNAFFRKRDPVEAMRLTGQLSRLALLGIIPSLLEADFNNFGESVHEFNRLAGEAFAEDQGGIYSCPRVAGMIETLRSWGVRGVGQSSWGPTIFAFAEDDTTADRIRERIRSAWNDVEAVQVSIPAKG